MVNYDYRTGSHRPPKYDGSEPELQWLEDSINMLINLTFACVFGLLRFAFSVVCGLFCRLFAKQK